LIQEFLRDWNVPFTKGFADAYTRRIHFEHHGSDFGAVTEEEYEALADEFLGGPMDDDTLECYRTRPDGTTGDTIRYNRRTEEFGVLGRDNVIRTYFKPRPSIHRERSNLDYFRKECRKVK